MLFQPPLPDEYLLLPPAEVERRILRLKARLGADLCILGHHYQRDEVFKFADFTGDSLRLSQRAAATDGRLIVFCGVHFMAETADILTAPEQAVFLPHLAAGCTMADMADADDLAEALEVIGRAAETGAPTPGGGPAVVPVTYVNSSAAAKAVTGRAGGACCTSSNARAVFEWALRPAREGGAGAGKILALPDEHLARNTAVAMGYAPDDCAVYDFRKPRGGLADEQVRAATFLLWRGHCYVHQRFTVEQVAAVRAADPLVKVIVHPECPHEVVQAADLAGSTEQILRAVSAAPAGSHWAVGTETNMVRRLAANNPDKAVRVLADIPPLCRTMGLIDNPHLLWVLDNLAAGRQVNRITVQPETAAAARVAVERMISLKPAPGPTRTRPAGP